MKAKKNINYIFVLFLFSHMTIWTLAPSMSNVNLPLDTIEALAWGSNLDWGFSKHPPLSAFMVEFFYQIFGNQDWAYYFLSQIFIIAAFFVIWIFSKDFFLDKVHSIISIFLLEGIYFYNYTSPEFNVYVCELPFWALTILFAWRGIKSNKNQDWLLFGLFAALGTLSHYLFLYLIISINIFLIYLLIKKRLNFKYFIFLFTFFIVLSPHIIWLSKNDFVTFIYAFQRTGFKEMIFLNHITQPIIFLFKQLGIILPMIIMFLFLCSNLKIKLNFKDKRLLFLLSINILPIFLIFVTSLMFGVKIRTMWMTPFYLFLGVLFIYLFKKRINFLKNKNFFIIFLAIFILSPISYLSVSLSKDNKRTDYPGKEIARLVQNKWNTNFRNEIKIVIGDEWSAGNLSYHLFSRPKWMLSLKNDTNSVRSNDGVIYVGNPKILKKLCPGVYGEIRPVGFCMIGQK